MCVSFGRAQNLRLGVSLLPADLQPATEAVNLRVCLTFSFTYCGGGSLVLRGPPGAELR